MWPSSYWRRPHQLCDGTSWGLPAHHVVKCPWFVFCLLLGHDPVQRSLGKVYNPYLLGFGTELLFIDDCLLSRNI